jgi:dipeptidyl aminopeptidase/acylaminoacyl peptidase
MLDDGSDTLGDKLGREFMRLRIGDRERDRERFNAVSPLVHAHRVQAPLMLIHGTEDRRVPISHSKLMMKALDKAGKRYEWHSLEGATHSLWRTMDRAAYYKHLLAFLERHLKD